jgi:hypothetical protein
MTTTKNIIVKIPESEMPKQFKHRRAFINGRLAQAGVPMNERRGTGELYLREGVVHRERQGDTIHFHWKG